MGTTFVIRRAQRHSRTKPITDDSGMQRFEIADYSRRWPPSRRLTIRDTAGAEVAVISHGAVRIHHELFVAGQRITMRPAGFNSRKLKITSADNRLEVAGDHRSDRPFSIIRGGAPAATVTFAKQSTTVAITDGEDPVLMLALVLAIADISSNLGMVQAAKPIRY